MRGQVVYDNDTRVGDDFQEGGDTTNFSGRLTPVGLKAWAQLGQNFGMINGNAYDTSGTLGTPNIDAGLADNILVGSMFIFGSGETAGLTARLADADNYLALHTGAGSTLTLLKRVAGVETNLGTFTFTFVAGALYYLTLELRGSAMKARLNGEIVITASDAAGNTNTKHGMYASGGSGATRFWAHVVQQI